MKTLLVSNLISHFCLSRALVDTILSVLNPLELEYPRFNNWFMRTVLPGLWTGGREIVLILNDDAPVGILILKRKRRERKICTLRVMESYQRMGYGTYLGEKASSLLGTATPMITVSSTRIREFLPLLRKGEYHLTEIADNYYRNASREFVFNGFLSTMHLAGLNGRFQEPNREYFRLTKGVYTTYFSKSHQSISIPRTSCMQENYLNAVATAK